MQEIKDNPELILQLIVTGMHLSANFGLTCEEIEADGFVSDRNVVALTNDDSPVGVAKSIGNALAGCAEAFRDLGPDVVVVLGDRFEIFAAACAAHVARIPLAHLHGGEPPGFANDHNDRSVHQRQNYRGSEPRCRRHPGPKAEPPNSNLDPQLRCQVRGKTTAKAP